jgi:hypothetical protein
MANFEIMQHVSNIDSSIFSDDSELTILNESTSKFMQQYINDLKNKNTHEYVLTVIRDDKEIQTAIAFGNAKEAIQGYEKYQDYGFAKNNLTVTLYEPNGIIHSKNFKRNQAGDPTFVRKNYYDTIELLKSIRDKTTPEVYDELVSGFANIFTEDNWRFNPDRFLEDLK